MFTVSNRLSSVKVGNVNHLGRIPGEKEIIFLSPEWENNTPFGPFTC
jgi:hypothetical protein